MDALHATHKTRWNKETNETTDVGAPEPTTMYARAEYREPTRAAVPGAPGTGAPRIVPALLPPPQHPPPATAAAFLSPPTHPPQCGASSHLPMVPALLPPPQHPPPATAAALLSPPPDPPQCGASSYLPAPTRPAPGPPVYHQPTDPRRAHQLPPPQHLQQGNHAQHAHHGQYQAGNNQGGWAANATGAHVNMARDGSTLPAGWVLDPRNRTP